MSDDPNYCWDQTVDDGRFQCRVLQLPSGYNGVLTVTVVDTTEEILRKSVGISYEARFGPDVSDVAEWQDASIEAIDAWIARQDSGEEVIEGG